MLSSVDWSIDVGNLLTILSVLVSLVALLSSWRKDRKLKERDQAARVRAALAAAGGNLQQWRGLAVSLFDRVEPLVIDTSRSLLKRFDVTAARDLFYQAIVAEHLAVLERMREGRLELPPEALYFRLDAYESFADTIGSCVEVEVQEFTKFVSRTEHAILEYSNKEKAYEPTELGNNLRQIIGECRESLFDRLTDAIRSTADLLSGLVFSPDSVLMKPRPREQSTAVG